MNQNRWDTVVVGAGPAGSTAALQLASKGYSVLLMDRDAFPREKVCGDGLIPDALRSLTRNGLYEEVAARANPVNAMTFYSPGKYSFSLQGEFLTIQRKHLDSILWKAARRSGSRFLNAAVEEVAVPDGETVVITCRSGRQLYARTAVIATGADIRLLDQLGMVKRRSPSAVAARQYLESDYRVEDIIISLDRSVLPGYAWIFPMSGNTYNAGCGVLYREGGNPGLNLRDALQSFTEHFEPARNLYAGAGHITPIKGARLRWGLMGLHTPVYKNSVVAIGETLGATFPLTGEGIGKAMETAELAAQSLDGVLSTKDPAALKQYPTRLRELQSTYQGYIQAQKWINYPWYLDILAKRAQHSIRLRQVLEGILTEQVNPAEIFSLKGL
ncbi:MAG TPA: geranylgeranyl reductase family protein, partial [bacterium]|nr:geranylgeranyl reductase family protein [bacterium]